MSKQTDASSALCTHTSTGVPVPRVQHAVVLRSAFLVLRRFGTLDAALEAPLGKVYANAELVSDGKVRARLIRRGGADQWLLVFQEEAR